MLKTRILIVLPTFCLVVILSCSKPSSPPTTVYNKAITAQILFDNLTDAYNTKDSVLYSFCLDTASFVYVNGRNLPVAQQQVWDYIQEVRLKGIFFREADSIDFSFSRNFILDPLVDSLSGENSNGAFKECTYERENRLLYTDAEKFVVMLQAIEKIEITIIKYDADSIWYISKWAVDG